MCLCVKDTGYIDHSVAVSRLEAPGLALKIQIKPHIFSDTGRVLHVWKKRHSTSAASPVDMSGESPAGVTSAYSQSHHL